MNKLEMRMVTAISEHKPFSEGNTKIEYKGHTTKVYLKDSLLATIHPHRIVVNRGNARKLHRRTVLSRLKAIGVSVVVGDSEAYVQGYKL